MKIAFLGNRGIPANFGGSDTAVEEISRRLVKDNVDVLVYCRKHNSTIDTRYYMGIERVVLPSLNTKQLDTLSHTLLSCIHVLFRRDVSIIHFNGYGMGLFVPLMRLLSRKKIVVAGDGFDWRRPKWGWFARRLLRLGHYLCVKFADELIIDNEPVLKWTEKKYGRKAHLIGYGTDRNRRTEYDELKRWGLRPNDYILAVGAMVPDKGPQIVLEAFTKTKIKQKLVLVGDTPYWSDFFNELTAKYEQDPRVVFTGYVFGEAYKQLVSHARVYVHAALVEGTSPALLQALGYGRCVVASDLEETADVVEGAALLFPKGNPDELRKRLVEVTANDSLRERYSQLASQLCEHRYDWDIIAKQYKEVFERALKGSVK